MFNFSLKESLDNLKRKNYDSKINKNIDILKSYEDYQLKVFASNEGLKLSHLIRLNFIDNVGFRCYNTQQDRYGRLPICKNIENFLNEDFKKSLTQTDNIIDYIKSELINWNDYNTWEDFIDSQEMEQRQSIVYYIEDIKNNLPIEIHFGEIEIDKEYYNVNEDEYIDKIPHHWITINNEIYEFSKGSLKNFIEWDDLYDVDTELKKYHEIR